MKRQFGKKLFILATLGCFFLTGTLALAAEAPITLRLAHTSAPKTTIFQTYAKFKELVEKKTEGKIIIQIFPSGQLGGDVPTAESVKKGQLDIASCGTNNMGPFTEMFFWADLPFMFKDIDAVHKVYGGDIGKEYKERVEKEVGFKVLFYADPGSFRALMNSKHAIRTPNDMKGLKFRSAPSPVEMDTVTAFGAAATPIAWTETYMALEQKVVDGEMQQYHWAVTARHQEVIRYVTEMGGQHALHLALMNKDSWSKLNPELQAKVQAAADEAQAWNFDNAAKLNDELRNKVLEAKVAIYVATPEEIAVWRKAGQTVWTKYADKVPQALIDRIQAAQK